MQRPHRVHFYIFLLTAAVALAACSNTKYLHKDQQLYIKSNINVKGDISSTDKQEIRTSLSSKQLMMQQPNGLFLGTRLKVWLYNKNQTHRKSNWFWKIMLTKRNMEAPSIYDSMKTKESVQRMVAYLNNQGYFYATIGYKESIKRQKVSVTYQVNTGKNFVINKVDWEIADSNIAQIVNKGMKLSLVKPGMSYKQELLGSERERLTRLIRDAGYYKFDREAIEFEVDTLHKLLFRNLMNPFEGIVNVYNERKGQDKPRMDITVKIHNDDSNHPYELYHLDSIYVYPDYPNYGSTADSTFKTMHTKALTIRFRQNILKESVLNRAVMLRPGELYSQQHTNDALSRLYDLGPWQFVNLQFRERKDTPNILSTYLYLSPKRRQELGANFEVSTSSDYLVGSGISLNYKHLNVGRSATQLNISLNTGIELIRNDNMWVLQSQEFGGQVNLVFPRFITPFNLASSNRSTVKTRLTFGADYLTRVDKFYISNINAAFGYEWNESAYKRWIVRPISLNYVGVNLNKTFRDSTVDKNPYLERSFEPVFIGGENITYIYANNDILHKLHNSYFRANLEESGGWLNGISSLMGSAFGKENSLERLTNMPIANFVKLELDYRHYWNFTEHTTLATRSYAGVGVPYGSTLVMPYIRQFTSGGPNSIRAWRLRTLGPGTYKDTSATAISFPDQTGDMKLEGNIEYRFDLLRLFEGTVNLKGATFVDIGNIWMLNKDTTRPGAEFQLKNVYHDLAVGTGAGLRLDFSFFLVRLDWGIPVKVPYFTGNKNGWYLSEWDLGDSKWRRDNIIWNIAIGYPF
jgi:outer membrane protein insertion porin family